jgi:hypothetical protein
MLMPGLDDAPEGWFWPPGGGRETPAGDLSVGTLHRDRKGDERHACADVSPEE